MQEKHAIYLSKVYGLPPSEEIYGSWARNHKECLAISTVTMPFVKVVQLCMAVVSICQVLFMITRAPKVPWEAIYLPGTEAISYGLSFFGEGYIRLANGKILPWCRMAAWLCCCPIMLGLVSNMALIKYKSQPLNPMMVAASIIRTVFGISATMAETESVIWTHAFFSFVFFFFEMIGAYAIFALTIQDFKDIGSPLALRVVGRLHLLRGIFFVTWNMYWILWIVSSTYACIIDENVNSILHLMGDLSCKNTYGLLLWATTWGLLNGKWDREYARNRDADGLLMEVDEKEEQKPVEPPNENFDVKVFGTTIASVRRSVRRPRADSEFVDRQKIRENRPGNRPGHRKKSLIDSRENSESDSDDYNHSRRGDTRDDSRRDRDDATRGYYDRDYDRDYDKEMRTDYDKHSRRKGRDNHRNKHDNDRRSQEGRRRKHRDDHSPCDEMPATNSEEMTTKMMSPANADANMAAILELMKRTTTTPSDANAKRLDSSMC